MDHLAVVAEYRSTLENFPNQQHHLDCDEALAGIPASMDAFGHAKWMLDKIEEFVAEDKLDKANRWLGFVQGIFYALGLYTINQMRDHNRGTECSE